MTTFSKWLVLLIILSLFPLQDLLYPGLFDGHDTPDHVARIANFYQNLAEGTIIPRWAGNLNWGYGHPILMFLYPLPSYAASLFHFLGVSLVDATKLVFAVAFMLSGITMYIWLRAEGNESAGFAAGILYLFAPYRFVDLYVRGAIGEHVFFIWPPLVCYFILRYFQTNRPLFGAAVSVSLALMILSHNALSIMFMPFIGVYALWFLFKSYKKNAAIKTLKTGVGLSGAFALGLGLSAFFWAPAFLEGKYTLRDIVTKDVLFDRFESFSRLVYSPWSFGGTGEMSVQAGPVHWVVLGVSLFLIIRLLNKRHRMPRYIKNPPEHGTFLLILSAIFFAVSVFFILEQSAPLYRNITLFQKFQFPWRWLSLAVFSASAAGGMAMAWLSEKKSVLPGLIACAVAIIYTVPFWHAKSYTDRPETYFTGIYNGTTDTGESSPVWSVRFMEREPAAPIEVIDGTAEITENERRIRRHSYTVNVFSENARILENTLYFPGWSVYIDGGKLPESAVEFQDPHHRGLITFTIPSGSHTVNLQFNETKLRTAANSISAISMFLLFGVVGYEKIRIPIKRP